MDIILFVLNEISPRAYKEGASGKDVMKKVKELKRRHRSAPALPGEERRGKYDRKRSESALLYFHEQEDAGQSEIEESEEDWEEHTSEGGGVEDYSSGGEEDCPGGGGGENGEVGEQEFKGAVWKLVSGFLWKTTGQGPFERQLFSFSELMKWLRESEKDPPDQEYLRMVIGRFDDIFSNDGDEICIVNPSPTEAERAFELEAEALKQSKIGRESIWTIVKQFISDTTGAKPFECQHFYLSDLQDWFANENADANGDELRRAFLNLKQLIDKYDDFSREDDSCWIEEYNSEEDD